MNSDRRFANVEDEMADGTSELRAQIDEAVAAGPIRDFITVLEEQGKPKRKSRKKPPPEPELRILAVACPYEKPRFEDATKTVEKGKAVQVKDISELLVESMEL